LHKPPHPTLPRCLRENRSTLRVFTQPGSNTEMGTRAWAGGLPLVSGPLLKSSAYEAICLWAQSCIICHISAACRPLPRNFATIEHLCAEGDRCRLDSKARFSHRFSAD